MKLGMSQDFASPEEAALAHYGVKGMRWGVRKEEDTSSRVAAKGNEESKLRMTPQLKMVPSSGTQKATQVSADAKQQKRVDKFLARADIMGAKISDLKLENEKLQGAKNPVKLYTKYSNKQSIGTLTKQQKRAVRDAQDAQKGKRLTKSQKQAIVGAVAVGAILAAGVAYHRGAESGAFNSAVLRGAAAIRGESSPFRTNPKLSGKMTTKELLENVAKPVNPGYSKAGGKMNCRRSTYVYELRRRGFDVHATTSAAGWGQSESGVINALTPGSKNFYRQLSMSQSVVRTGKSSVARGDTRLNPVKKILLGNLDTGGPDGMTPGFGSKKVFEALSKQPNGSRGEVLFKFPMFGHSMAYEIVDGKPHIFDSQKGTYHDLTKLVEDKWGNFHGAEITRLDNVDLDLNFLSRWATNN